MIALRIIAASVAIVLASTYAARASRAPISLDVRDTDIVDVVRLLSAQSGVNIVTDTSVKHERITLRLQSVSFEDALATLARANDLSVRKEFGVVILGTSTSMNRRFADAPDRLSSKTAVIALRNAKPEDLIKPLSDALPLGTIVVADKRTGSLLVTGNAQTVERARTLIVALDAPARTLVSAHTTEAIPLRYMKAADALKLLRGFVPDGTAVADDRQNAIVTSGTGEIVDTVRSFVAQVDRPERQVMFEVKVIDIEPQNDASNVGIEFGGVDFNSQPISGATTYAFARNSVSINARLNALVTSGHAQILATPRLVTMNNREATMLIGQTYPIVYFDIRSGNQQVQNIDIGVKLRLTPTIGADGSITAELHPEYSAIQSFVQNYPVIANRKLDSVLRIQDGETIVLGGLLKETDSEAITKIPGLSSLPILGGFFKNRQRSHQRDEIVFLITPRIVR